MSGWSFAFQGADHLLLALLLIGHVFADFLVQTDGVAWQKRHKTSRLLLHGVLVAITHLVLLIPFWNRQVVAGILLLSLVHMLVDRVRSIIDPRWVQPLASFLADQALHVATVLVLWRVLLAYDAVQLNRLLPISIQQLALATGYLVIAAGFVFNAKGGTVIVRSILERYPQVVPGGIEAESSRYAMGRTIGVLERFLIFPLVLFGQWAALAFAIAAKSIARFRELDSKDFADYYLIGTLTSILVAVASAILIRLLLFAPPA